MEGSGILASPSFPRENTPMLNSHTTRRNARSNILDRVRLTGLKFLSLPGDGENETGCRLQYPNLCEAGCIDAWGEGI